MELETFEEYWERSPKFGDLENIPVSMAKLAMSSAYVAGQTAGLKYSNELIKSTN